jgi:outer membrane biosynthesis protein TonB
LSTPLRERPDAPLGTLIFRAGLLPAETIESALEEGVKTGKRLGEILTERGLLKEADLARLLAGQKGLEFVNLREQIVDHGAAGLFSEDQARLFRALPYAFDGGVPVVAIADPTDEVLTRNICEALGRGDARFVVSVRSELVDIIGNVYADGFLPAPPPAPAPQLEAPEPEAPEPEAYAPEPPVQAADPLPQPAPEPEPAVELPAPEPVAEAEALPEPLHENGFGAPEHVELPGATMRIPKPEPLAPAPLPEPVAAAEPVEAAQPPVEAVQPPVEPAPVAQPPVEIQATAPEPVPQTVTEPQLEPQPQPEQAPEPVVVTPPAPVPVAPAPAPEPEPAPAPEPAAADVPAAHRLSLRLTNGERVEAGAYADLEAAKQQAKALMAQVAAADGGDWPFVNGRFIKPDTIVSVDIV